MPLSNLFKYRVLLLIFSGLIVSNFTIYSQKTGSLRGQLVDINSGNVLPFGNILITELGTGTSSDDRGFFIFTGLQSERYYTLKFSYVGYKSLVDTFFIAPGKITETLIRLEPNPVEIQTVEKIGEKIAGNNIDISLNRIAAQDLERLPQGVETDLMRSLQYLPGVTTTGDVSANYYVRGGESNQNLVVLDGVTLYNPFHAMGVFSVIDPEIINSVEFYKGGFPVEYGGRLSSVLKISTKDGNKYRYSGQASASLLSGKVSFEGPIPHGSFIVAARKSYSTEILKKFFNGRRAPFDFYDFSFKASYQNNEKDFIDDSKFTIHGFFSGDKLINSSPFSEDITWHNNILGLKRFQVYDIPMYSEITIAVSNFEAEVIPKLSGVRPTKNKVEEVVARSDFNYVYSTKDELGLGLIFMGIRTQLQQLNGRGIWVNINDFGGNVSVYGKYKFLRWNNFGVDAGARINLEAVKEGGNFYIEPRLNLVYRIIPRIAIKGSWGLFQQSVTTLYDESEVISVFEPWFITPNYLKPARAIHYNIGTEIDITDEINLNVEGYFKILQHLPTLNPDKNYREDPDLVEGYGQSYGWEFTAKFIKEPFYFTGSYSLSWAYKTVDKWKYYPRYDSRHSVKLLLDVNLGKGWQASSAWLFNSGFPFTPTVGYYHKLFSDDFTGDDIYEGYQPYVILGDRNINRLPAYHRLDISVNKKFSLWDVNFRLEFNMLNVYDRDNLFYYDRNTGERVNMMPRLTTAGIRIEI